MTTPEQPPLLNWGDRTHFRSTPAPCILCRKPAMLRSHAGEAVHKVCAEIWNSRNPNEVRFVSDDRPRRRKDASAHA
ncbi:hypothetical protein ABZ516_31175 [Streptomyces sp. NPDC019826]|uniref:hypothetical protein n=1 Tax=Streptomyces sp. NPDC019826 TaxID=3156667 RepID=UPI0033EBA9B5